MVSLSIYLSIWHLLVLAVLVLFTEPEQWILNTTSSRASESAKNPTDVHVTPYLLGLPCMFLRLKTSSESFRTLFKT